jgi:hypothetical protein
LGNDFFRFRPDDGIAITDRISRFEPLNAIPLILREVKDSCDFAQMV